MNTDWDGGDPFFTLSHFLFPSVRDLFHLLSIANIFTTNHCKIFLCLLHFGSLWVSFPEHPTLQRISPLRFELKFAQWVQFNSELIKSPPFHHFRLPFFSWFHLTINKLVDLAVFFAQSCLSGTLFSGASFNNGFTVLLGVLKFLVELG